MADRILVTGASGFVGSAVARLAVQRGYDVGVLVRATSSRANLEGLDCEIVTGDMRDTASMERALKGVRFLLHVAADYRLWARDPEEIVRNNVEGTRATMEAALAAGVERIVYTSSVATLKPLNRCAADETSRHDEQSAIGAYKLSKLLAERLVEKMVAERGLPAIIVNPSTPIGPRDIRPTPTGRIIVEAATGRMPAFVDTGLNLVHVEDVALGHFLALDKGRVGESYGLGGSDVSLKEMLAAIAKLPGRHAPRVRLPRLPLLPLAYGADAGGPQTGRGPSSTAGRLRGAKSSKFFSSAKAVSELGYHARPYREGLADALAWFRQAGYLK